MTLTDFRHVRAAIQPHIRTTPIVPAGFPNLFLKLENLQRTHSFKVRGAFARVLSLLEDGEKRVILTVSAGNHGQAVALAASEYNLPCRVIVPRNAPETKIDAIRSYGVELFIQGANYDEAETAALGVAAEANRYVFVSPYNDRRIVLGQGSLGFEILEQLPQITTIVIPIGGGGLAAGVAAVVKQLRPEVRIIGVQAEVSAAIYHSLAAGRMLTVPDRPSIADGIAGNIDLETITFPVIQKFIDEVIVVTEDEIKHGIEHLLFGEKLLAEGSAAAAFAAVTTGKIPASGPTVAIITGGNTDVAAMLH